MSKEQTPEQIMKQDARCHWERARAGWLCQDADRMHRAGKTPEAFHKYETVRTLLNIALDDETDQYEEPELKKIASDLRRYLAKNWTDHRNARLQVLRDRQK